MRDKALKGASRRRSGESDTLLSCCSEVIPRLMEKTGANRWGLAQASFVAALERSSQKRFQDADPAPEELEAYLFSLHANDLALACACAEGQPAAWEEFMANYREYLRASAAAIMRCPAGTPRADELADSLFAELYGVTESTGRQRSLFHYFHGRSSLKTWLRAVLAQRHVDALRAWKKFQPLGDETEVETKLSRTPAQETQPLPDPDRPRYVKLFQHALEASLHKLQPRDRERLRLYYVQDQTLAEIGRKLGEHESSASRNLERVRNDLRRQVEEMLRRGNFEPDGSAGCKGFSEEQIALCFEYAASDAPIDLDRIFADRKGVQAARLRRET